MSEKNMEDPNRGKTVEAEVDITVTWKGEAIRRARKGLWWSQLTKEEILSEIEEGATVEVPPSIEREVKAKLDMLQAAEVAAAAGVVG